MKPASTIIVAVMIGLFSSEGFAATSASPSKGASQKKILSRADMAKVYAGKSITVRIDNRFGFSRLK